MRWASYRNRPVHLGPYPMERLPRAARAEAPPSTLPRMRVLSFDDAPQDSIIHAMAPYMAMFDLIREGQVNPAEAELSGDPLERAEHLKSAAYYFDATFAGVCCIPHGAHLTRPISNPKVKALGEALAQSQPKSFAAGMDMILADVVDSSGMQHGSVEHHTHALVVAVEYPRDPRPDEVGCEWLHGAQAHRAALLASQVAVLLSSYLRMLGFSARSHSLTASELDLSQLAWCAGLTDAYGNQPFVESRMAIAAVSTTLTMQPDAPLVTPNLGAKGRGLGWWLGYGSLRTAWNRHPMANRDYRLGPHPIETLPKRDAPTTFIDHERVPRFPKRADFFARALFGDLGADVQRDAKDAHYVMKSPIGACARRALGALLLLQFGEAKGQVRPEATNPQHNADKLKATSYFLGMDAVGLCKVPSWAYYSHDAGGNPLPAYHPHAVNLLVDQGHETMEGASGDDWISVAQSMRAYLRFSLMGGVLAEQIRRQGYGARVHSVLDGDVLQPPLLLLSGLGEVSRIGEVILNPFLGPRLKSGTVTTDMPMTFDQPIDFGLQRFCQSCNKCARECPSGAITAGPKVMYNGYEIWKSDAEKCTRYRITNVAGGMCGRCMKTCPWNLEGLLADELWRAVATRVPQSAPWLARLDDWLDRGSINPKKKWWWDIELDRSRGRYVRASQTNQRTLQKTLVIKPDEQTLAVYPADAMPLPYPVTQPVDREAGIQRYKQLLSPARYQQRLVESKTQHLVPPSRQIPAQPPVFPVRVHSRTDLSETVVQFELRALDDGDLPAFEAGAHIDVVIAPEYQRAYSLASDPARRDHYLIGVLREDPRAGGRGGSALMHRVFRPGRQVFISRPINHFPFQPHATRSWLMAGGIGVTPLIAMAHHLHAQQGDFVMHLSVRERAVSGYADWLQTMPWKDKVQVHASQEGARLDLQQALPAYQPGFMLYTCGSPAYMDAVFDTAAAQGWPDTACQREYFHVPESPQWDNHPFVLRLGADGLRLQVAADQRATEVLAAHGVSTEVKCSDGLCGVCACAYDAELSSEIEHRDFVLSQSQRQERVILCCSRAREPGGEIVLRLP
jgi:reductive dehalogenase